MALHNSPSTSGRLNSPKMCKQFCTSTTSRSTVTSKSVESEILYSWLNFSRCASLGKWSDKKETACQPPVQFDLPRASIIDINSNKSKERTLPWRLGCKSTSATASHPPEVQI